MKYLRSQNLVCLTLASALAFTAPSCGGGGSGSNNGLAQSPPASSFDSVVAQRWYELLYTRVKATNVNPPAASRLFGCSGVALYEAILPGMSTHRSLQGQLNSLPVGTFAAPANAIHHWPSVANRALATVASHFLTDATSQTAITDLYDELQADFDVGQTAAVLARSSAHGTAVADAVMTWSDSDGIADQTACGAAFVPPVLPGDGGWEPIAPAMGVGLLPCWGQLRCLAVAASDTCAPLDPPAYSTATDSAWYAEGLLVVNTTGSLGANLSTDQRSIAFFWADNASATGTPGGHWISITSQLCAEHDIKLDRAAEAFARVGIAMADAFITCWEAKFVHYLKRPKTYINEVIDGTWEPLLGTPNFPTYTSGHSSQSAAAATVLTDMFGPLPFTDRTHELLNPELVVLDPVAFASRSFDNFYDAANEAAASRLYGGIHFQFDNEAGADSGVCIGTLVNQLQFRNP
jgi:hypothetical protein